MSREDGDGRADVLMEDNSSSNNIVNVSKAQPHLGIMSDEDFKTLQELYIEVTTLYYMVKNKRELPLVKD